MPKMGAPQSPFLLISTLLLSFVLFAAANSAAIATAVAADTATDHNDESSSPPPTEDDDEGFHLVELVHMHDPRIPGNENLNLDKYEALRERVLTSVAKRHHDSHHKINKKKKKKKTDWSSPGMIQMVMKTGFDYLSSEYFVQVRVGTPSQNFWLVADTGSELTWFRCNDDHTNETKTELESHGHNRRSALRVNGRREFYRRLSTTYKKVTCGDPRCASPEFLNMCSLPECELPTDLCPYEYS